MLLTYEIIPPKGSDTTKNTGMLVNILYFARMYHSIKSRLSSTCIDWAWYCAWYCDFGNHRASDIGMFFVEKWEVHNYVALDYRLLEY